jgi:ABC-type bacteriocin/lantibiotic exporter with double-glycine peptidase domain
MQLPNHCGAACIKMVLAIFDISENQKSLGEICNITSEGIATSAIIKCFKKYKINSYYRRHVGERYTIDDYLNKYKYPVIIGTEAHYMVIVGYTEKMFIIVDPEVGKQISMPKTVVLALIKDLIIIRGKGRYVTKRS